MMSICTKMHQYVFKSSVGKVHVEGYDDITLKDLPHPQENSNKQMRGIN